MKRVSLFIAVVLIFSLFCVPALAANESQLGYVTDEAMILTDQEYAELEKKAESISEKYQCGVYIVTVGDFTDYVNTNDIYEAAKSIYNEYSMGWGSERSGELLLLSMSDRDYSLIAYGYGNTAFTDYGKDQLAETFLDDFADDDWYEGFDDYLDKSESMLKDARDGKPLDVGSDPKIKTVGILISVVLGCLIALAVCLLLRSRMKSVANKTEANTYIKSGSVNITVRDDLFIRTTETRTKIEKSSGGGGTSVDSSGFSGKSGKF